MPTAGPEGPSTAAPDDHAPPDALWLGVDLGTQGVRAALVDDAGALVGAGSVALSSARREDGRHEQDPAEWWEATCTAVRSALAGRGTRPVGAVSLDGTSGTFVLQDDRARPLSPGVMYDDRRATTEAAEIRDADPAYWSGLGYHLQPSWALPKLVALARAGALPPGGRLAHQGDHIAGRLAGRPVATDTSQALKTGYDPLRERWPAALLERFALDAPTLLPDVVLPGTPVGEVGAEAARLTGLPPGTPIKAGMTDGCAAQVATGALSPGQWCAALGTTLVLKGTSAELIRDPSGAVYCHRNPDGGWLPGGASHTGTGILATEFPGQDLQELTRQARHLAVPGGATYPLSGTGERFPFVAGDAHAFDLPPAGAADPAEGLPAGAVRLHRVLHGLAYVERLAFDTLAALGADISGPVTATGGATRNDWLTQLRADVLGRPVQVPAHADSAFGSAIVARAPVGALARTAHRMVRIERRFLPEASPGIRQDLDAGYHRLVDALRERGWLHHDHPTQERLTA